ncbi:hypothetical protein JZK55_11240 [Dissulfurispira thermophila]|uniref:4Fe-4S ferredoxin-type domain-containing protein n=2 Tax=root TaxID=1 RepID=A0A7G1H1W1_9BACT|nr:4Fe-4S dicluster domain-containing protein [Dissulfurispira thermophila]BCB96202.1 hypothetical protein JZK55_11240 [Dissulfurispira thermophila]
MLQGKIIDTISNTSDAIVIDQSRCLRMRFNRSDCSECIEHCRFNAVRIDEGVDIKRNICSECMLCVSVCPSGCFNVKAMDFYSIISRLKKLSNSVPAPVLGCNARADIKAHEKTACLGFLSEEHIIALSVFLEEKLQVNLTGCADCRNGFIADNLKKRMESIAEKTSLNIFEKISLVKDRSELCYQDILLDRRGFFKAIKNLTFLQAVNLLESSATADNTRSYSTKRVTVRRDLLNRVIGNLPEWNYTGVIDAYYYNLRIDEGCDNCFACVGMCPTGALKIGTKEAGPELTFNSSLCSGCGLCEGFCMNNAILIERGFRGHNPFEFSSVKNGLLCNT